MINAITNILGWIVKNINMILGVVGGLVKLIVAILHVWKPEKDNWVDGVQNFNEWVQANLFKWAKRLYQLGK